MAKQKLKQIILILGLFALLGQAFIVSADFDPVQRNRKTLLIHPFNPIATGNDIVGKYDNQWYNIFNQGNALVDSHLSFKNQYYPQPPLDADTPVKAGAENKSGPDTQHNHAWFNDSVEDNYYYLAVLDSYEITLAPDVLKKIDLNSLRCYTPTETNVFETPCFDPADMNKPYFTSDFYGTTRITFNQTTGTITWKFVAMGGPGRPVIMGKNPGLNFIPEMPKTTGAGDQSDKWNRSFEASVSMTTNSNPERIWSGTTSSRALVRYEAIAKSAVKTAAPNYGNLYTETCVGNGTPQAQHDNYSHWCSMTPQQVGSTNVIEGTQPGNDGKTYYWEQIATVSTIWKKPDTPPPPSECDGLTITDPKAPTLTPVGTSPFNMYNLVKNTEAAFTVEPSFTNGEVPLDYKWQAAPIIVPSSLNHGLFADQFNANDFANPYIDLNGWFNIEDKSTYYTGGAEGTFIKVEGVYPNDDPDPTKRGKYVGNYCMATMIIPPELNTCTDLKISPTTIEENTPVTFTVTPEFEDPTQPINLDYKWSSRDGSTGYLPGYVDFSKFENINAASFVTNDPEKSVIDVSGYSSDIQTNLLAATPSPLPQGDSPPAENPGPNTAVNPATPAPSYTPPAFSFGTAPGLQFGPLFDKFADSSTSTDYDNPYFETELSIAGDDRSTYYTGGEAETVIEVQGFNKDTGEIYPLCKADLQIPPTRINNNKCLDATIVQGQVTPVAVGDEVALEDPIEGLWVRVNTDPAEYEADLAFDWEVRGGGELYGNANNYGTRVSTSNFADTVDLTGAVEGTTVSVAAVDPENELENIEICKDDFTVTAAPQLMCRDIRVTPLKSKFGPGLETPLSASPINTDDSLVSSVDWYEEGPGHFSKGPTAIRQAVFPIRPMKMACPDPADSITGDVTEFTAPAHCDYVYVAGATGGGLVRLTANPNLGDSRNCIYERTVPSTPGPVECDYLRFNESVITPGQDQVLSGSVRFTDDTTRNVIISWEGEEIDIAPPENQPTPSNSFTKNITVNDEASTVRATVSALVNPDPTVDLASLAQCTDQLSTTPDELVECDYLRFDESTITPGQSQTLRGEVRFTDDKTREIIVSWEGEEVDITPPVDQSTQSNSFTKNITVNDADSTVRATVTELVTADPDVDLASLAQCTDELSTKPDDCRKIRFNRSRKPGYVCIDVVEGTYEKEYAWYMEGDPIPEEGDCIPEEDFNEDDYLVYAKDFPQICRLQNTPDEEQTPPEFSKLVKQADRGGYKSVVSASLDPNNPTEFDYKLTFTSRSDNTTATVTDPDMIDGIEGTLLPAEYAYKYTPGKLNYNSGSTRVIGLPACDENEDEEEWNNCYRPFPADIRDGIELIKLDDNTQVTITYSADIDGSPIQDPEVCRNGEVCEEYYVNKANATWKITGSSEQVLENGTLWDEARIQAFCQYILTRAAGDIFLETDLDYGVDINRCSEYTTSTGVIVTPGQPDQPGIVSSGASDETTRIFSINHEICSEGQAGTLSTELGEFYGQDITGLSSQICEVKLQTGSPWKQEIITNNIEENKLRLSRWGADYNYAMDITNPELKDKDVVYIKGANLTVPSTNYEHEKGAKTFIVENGDLIINGNITYKDQQNYENVRDTASLAFIVLNGKVVIESDVEVISGVFFVQEGETAGSGQLISSPPDEYTYESLFVYGSIYGDLEPLFAKRLFAGDPSEDAGGIVIRFDQRILLNTPPGLRDVLDVSQTEVAR